MRQDDVVFTLDLQGTSKMVGTAWPGMAWNGMAWSGMAWAQHWNAWLGMASLGMAWHGTAWNGRQGMEWYAHVHLILPRHILYAVQLETRNDRLTTRGGAHRLIQSDSPPWAGC